MAKSILSRLAKDAILIGLGIFSASFGFKGFLLTNNFIDGGATGISLLLSITTHVPLHYLILVTNIPFVILGYLTIGKVFALKSAIAISCLALCLATINFPDITNDSLLVAVFGGFFLGAGIGLTVRGGAVIDGTEILAIFISKRMGTSMGQIIIMINVVIFSLAAYLLTIEVALYSMITYIAASKTLDFIIEGIEEYIGVSIMTTKSAEIKHMIVDTLNRGVTVYVGNQGIGKTGEVTTVDVVYSVITRLEINRLKAEVEKIDPDCFIVMNSVKDTKGGTITQRPLKHDL